ncbi:MAG TPA: hypothetical protein VGY54_23380 [Polyangiaceae bacterium]|jgi:hypothetical protein|nr:hypothetical protein [Polyangiaceae bacterium]
MNRFSLALGLILGSRAVKAPEAAPPPANVRLTIDAPSPHGSWTMRVANDGEIPVRLAADARLLTLALTPRGAKKAVRCRLPADMRPGDDLGRSIVLQAKRDYVETFEPRLYCLSGKGLDALAPGAILVARLGWDGKGATSPLEVAPIDGVDPLIAPLKSIESAPIALPDETTPALEPQAPRATEASLDAPRLELSATSTVDAESPDNASITVTLRNESSHPVVVHFRPETLGFEVVRAGGGGVEYCPWPAPKAGAARELFTTLAPKNGTAQLTVMLSAYCVGNIVDTAGLFVVRPWLDTRSDSGENVGVRSYDGRIDAKSPTFVRLHRGAVADPEARARMQGQ